MSRRRFGISVSSSIAEWLDKLAKRLGVDRSRLVERALESFLHEYAHYLYEHECKGVMIAVKRNGSGDTAKIIEKYRDIVLSNMHHHIGDLCVDILVVKGSSKKIAELHSALTSIKDCIVRYVPIMEQTG